MADDFPKRERIALDQGEEGGGVAQKECGGCFWGRVIKYRGVAEDT